MAQEKCSFVEITILKWKKHQRKDVKKPTWFALSNDLVCDSDFYDFTAEEFKAWIYALSMASKKQSDTIKINYQHAEIVSRIKKDDLDAALEKLSQLCIVTVNVTDASRERNANVTPHYKTRQDKTEHNTCSDQTAAHLIVADEYPESFAQLIKIFNERSVTPALACAWIKTYPDPTWVILEIGKALTWELANPHKRKKQFGRFISNWLGRGWDKSRARLPSNTIATRTHE